MNWIRCADVRTPRTGRTRAGADAGARRGGLCQTSGGTDRTSELQASIKRHQAAAFPFDNPIFSAATIFHSGVYCFV